MLTLYEPNVPAFRPWFVPRRDTYWEDFFPESFDSINRFPRAEMHREDGHYRLTAEVPGMGEEDVQVEVQDGVLTITGEKKQEVQESEEGYNFSERRYGFFKRSFCLPSDASEDNIEAKMDKGVLSITIPMAEEKSRRIEVKAA